MPHIQQNPQAADEMLSGSGAPASSLGNIGDKYLDTTTKDFYEKTGVSTWVLTTNLGGSGGGGGGSDGIYGKFSPTPSFIIASNCDLLNTSQQSLSALAGKTISVGSVGLFIGQSNPAENGIRTVNNFYMPGSLSYNGNDYIPYTNNQTENNGYWFTGWRYFKEYSQAMTVYVHDNNDGTAEIICWGARGKNCWIALRTFYWDSNNPNFDYFYAEGVEGTDLSNQTSPTELYPNVDGVIFSAETPSSITRTSGASQSSDFVYGKDVVADGSIYKYIGQTNPTLETSPISFFYYASNTDSVYKILNNTIITNSFKNQTIEIYSGCNFTDSSFYNCKLILKNGCSVESIRNSFVNCSIESSSDSGYTYFTSTASSFFSTVIKSIGSLILTDFHFFTLTRVEVCESVTIQGGFDSFKSSIQCGGISITGDFTCGDVVSESAAFFGGTMSEYSIIKTGYASFFGSSNIIFRSNLLAGTIDIFGTLENGVRFESPSIKCSLLKFSQNFTISLSSSFNTFACDTVWIDPYYASPKIITVGAECCFSAQYFRGNAGASINTIPASSRNIVITNTEKTWITSAGVIGHS